jgi:hypothetical protein
VEKQPAMACFVAGSTRWLEALFRKNEGGTDVGHDLSKVLRIESTSNTPHDNAKRSKISTSLSDLPCSATSSFSTKAVPLFSTKLQKRRDRDVAECLAYDALPQAKRARPFT